MIERLLSPQLVEAIGWTLVHALWQGALFALLLGLTLIGLRSFSAQARYLVAVAFLAAFFVATGATFASLYPTPEVRVGSEMYRADRSTEAEVATPTPIVESGGEATSGFAPSGAVNYLATGRAYFDRHLPLIVTVWLLGVLVLQLRFIGQLALVQRLKNYGTRRFPAEWAGRLKDLEARLGVSRPVRYLTSYRVRGPFTAGWLRPVILLPEGMLEQLRESQIMAVLAHELAHIRRHDFAVNLMQTVLTTFFFYHPGVWWINARIHDEREHACDDLAVAATGGRTDYARTLLELREREGSTPKLAMAYGGGGFGYRVRRLLTGYLNTATFGEGVVTTLIFVLVGSLAIAARPSAASELTLVETAREFPKNMAPAPPPPVIPPPFDFDFDQHTDVHVDQNTNDPIPSGSEFELLMEAIYEGQTEMAHYLLDRVDDLSRTDDRDFTPLMAAASENEAEIARLILERGVDVDQTNRSGWTALTEAADEGSLEVARLLLAAGARVNHRGPNTQRNAVSMAASEGHLALLRLLIEAGGTLNGEDGATPALHLAAEEGKSHVVRALIDEYEVDVNAVGPRDRTALMYAAAERHADIVSLLLDAGASTDQLDDSGNSPIAYAIDEAASESLQRMTERMGEVAVERLLQTPHILIGPAGEGDLLTVKAMVQMGIDVNITDEEGNTPLGAAAREGHLFVARYLLEQGARVEGSSDQCPPIFLSAREGHPDMIDLLIEHGATLENGCNYREINFDEINTLNDYAGSTPLLVAIEENSPTTIRRLLGLGADPNGTSAKTSYLLPDRVDWQHVNRLEAAELEHRYALRYRTRQWTPLLEAVETGERRLVRLLLEAGADPGHRTAEGLTALGLAEELGHDDIIQLLQ